MMVINSIFRKKISLLLVLIFIVFITYWQLPYTFYQQDEWIAVGQFLSGGLFAQTSLVNPFFLMMGSNRVLSHPFHMIFYSYFPFNILPFVLFSFIFHSANTIIAYHLVNRVSRNNVVAFIAASFFAVSSSASQAIIWAGASTTTLPSMTFILLSIHSYLNFLEKDKIFKLILSFVFLITAYLFKESSIFLIIFFPILFFLFKNKSSKFNLRFYIPIIIYFLISIFSRVVEVSRFTDPSAAGRVGLNTGIFTKLFYFSWMYPLTAISQFYIQQRDMFASALKFERINYPFLAETNLSGIIAEQPIADLISVLLSFLVILLFLYIYKKSSKYKKLIIFSFSFIILSISPFLILNKPNSYLESRYYYIGGLGAGILLGVAVDFILIKNSKLSFFLKKTANLALVLSVLFLFYSNINSVYKDFELQVMLGDVRKMIIKETKETYTNLPERPVFLVTGDQAHYGLNQYIPFQQGAGYSLMVLFYNTGKIPQELVSENFLWNVGAEGYRAIGEKGFGYFSSSESLYQAVDKNKLNSNQIVSFKYLTKEKRFIDETRKIRKEIDRRSK